MKGLIITYFILAISIGLGTLIGFSPQEAIAQQIKQVDVVEEKMVTLIGTGFDEDRGDDLTYRWSQLDGERVILSSYTVKEPQFMAPSVESGQVKILTFRLTVTDPFLASDSDTIQIIVHPVNRSPTVDAGRDKVLYEGVNALTLFASGYDPDDDVLSYSWKQIAGERVGLFYADKKHLTIFSGLSFDDLTGPLEFEVTVDDHFSGTDSDTVKVYPFGFLQSNLYMSVEAGPMQVVQEGTVVTLRGSGQNTLDKPIRFSWTQSLGPGVVLSSNTMETTRFVAPDLQGEQYAVLSFLLTGYAEGLGHATDLTIVKVLPFNAPPIADAGPDQTVNEKTIVKLAGSGNDPDNDKIRLNWNQVGGDSVFLSSLQETNPTFVAPDLLPDETMTLTFELTVTDPYRASDSDTVQVKIASINQAPFANAGRDQIVNEESIVTLAGSGIDPDNDPTTLSWSQISGQAVTLSSNSAPNPTFVAPDVMPRQTKTLIFELTVNDPYQSSRPDTIVVKVIPINAKPSANAGPDKTVNEKSLVKVSCSGTDPDNDNLTYSWRQVAGQSVSISSTNSPSFTFMAPEVVINETLTFECTVSDGMFTASDTVNVIVRNELTGKIVADAGKDRIVDEETVIGLDGSGSFDPENQQLFYSWTQISGESVSLSSDSVVQPNFVSPMVENNEVKVLVFGLVVFDDNGRQDSDTVTITVDPINAIPEATANARQG